jgi:hypothetical protein
MANRRFKRVPLPAIPILMTKEPVNTLIPFAGNIWIANGPAVNFFSFPYPVRMTVIRLAGNRLFVHSPIRLTPELQQQVMDLGETAFLVSPNKIHHLYLGEWKNKFPEAKLFASPGLVAKRKDLSFDAELGDHPEAGWREEIDQLIFKGSRAMDEVVFFHEATRTLILADLIENFEPNWFTGWRNWTARLLGILAPNGKAPLDFRLTFLGHKDQTRQSLTRMINWAPEKIIIAHGRCFTTNGLQELKRAFNWAI